MAGVSPAINVALMAVILFVVTSTLEAAVPSPRIPRETDDSVPIIFPRSGEPRDPSQFGGTSSLAFGDARAAESVLPGHEGNLEPDFSRKFLDKFSTLKHKRWDTPSFVFPKMRAAL